MYVLFFFFFGWGEGEGVIDIFNFFFFFRNEIHYLKCYQKRKSLKSKSGYAKYFNWINLIVVLTHCVKILYSTPQKYVVEQIQFVVFFLFIYYARWSWTCDAIFNKISIIKTSSLCCLDSCMCVLWIAMHLLSAAHVRLKPIFHKENLISYLKCIKYLNSLLLNRCSFFRSTLESIQTNHKTYFNDDKLVFRTRLGGCRERFRLRSTPIDEYLGASPVFPTLFEENRLN